MSIEDVAAEVAFHFSVDVDRMRKWRRHRDMSVPRQVAMYICRRMTKASFPAIGRWFGGRHHTTVMHACRNIERQWCVNGKIAGMVEGLCQVLEARRTA